MKSFKAQLEEAGRNEFTSEEDIIKDIKRDMELKEILKDIEDYKDKSEVFEKYYDDYLKEPKDQMSLRQKLGCSILGMFTFRGPQFNAVEALRMIYENPDFENENIRKTNEILNGIFKSPFENKLYNTFDIENTVFILEDKNKKEVFLDIFKESLLKEFKNKINFEKFNPNDSIKKIRIIEEAQKNNIDTDIFKDLDENQSELILEAKLNKLSDLNIEKLINLPYEEMSKKMYDLFESENKTISKNIEFIEETNQIIINYKSIDELIQSFLPNKDNSDKIIENDIETELSDDDYIPEYQNDDYIPE